VSRLRHIAETVGGDSFRVETIRGVGYRLVDAEDCAAEVGRGSSGGEHWVSRRTVVAGTAAVAALAAGGTWLVPLADHKPVPLAQQYYRRGLETRGQNSLELSERGAALFREATRVDPQFADAWGALSWSYRGLLEYQYRRQEDAARLSALSRAAAARALELDPNNADAQAALLLLKPIFGNWAAIEGGCRRLLKRQPRHSILEYNLGHTLTQVGRWRESVPFLRAVAEREPFWPLAHGSLAQAMYSGGSVQEAEDLIEASMRRFPGHIDFWLMNVRHLTSSGRLQEALAFAADASKRPAERSAVQPEIEFEISVMKALADGSTKVRSAVVRKVSHSARQFPRYIGHAAVTAALMGDLDASFAMLDGYYFAEGPWAFAHWQRPRTSLLFVAETIPLRADPRFPALLRKTALEYYWNSTGTVPDYRRFPVPKNRLPIG
jgi:tetratricopeptide (TPR) repeat protein